MTLFKVIVYEYYYIITMKNASTKKKILSGDITARVEPPWINLIKAEPVGNKNYIYYVKVEIYNNYESATSKTIK